MRSLALAIATIALGLVFAWLGLRNLRKHQQRYAALQRVMGTGAFPEAGKKADTFRSFLADGGRLTIAIGLLIAALGTFRVVTLLLGLATE